MDAKKVVVAGVTGAIGSVVARSLISAGYDVYGVARDPEKANSMVNGMSLCIKWDINRPDELSSIAEGSRAVINLTGAPLLTKWKGDYEKEIVSSRVEGTKYVVEAIKNCEEKPEVLINASAAGFYGYEGNREAVESSPAGKDFWGKLVSDWENAALQAEKSGLRTVLIRTTLVLMRGEGALKVLEPYFRKGLGGYVSPGDQVFPWIHIDDEVGIIMKAIENDRFRGPVNCVGGTITSRDFSRQIGMALGRGSRLPIPKVIIRAMFGKASDLVLQSQIIKSERMDELGYEIRYGKIGDALKEIFKQPER
ncbi:MAG: TIGR01777 family oxidoreductase [Candidatus Thermoplasmatota archaeon]|jgi:hypothetical protein|nr:TIGR01777 family oxidoreductase [Candidatus Thermoplasmatota archaeon]MCL5790511.1 TIGR01777 family oxidoreductase [Candidatus Thermoplasmatota archaeon]